MAGGIPFEQLYTRTLTSADYEIDPTSGLVSYLYIVDLPAGNFL